MTATDAAAPFPATDAIRAEFPALGRRHHGHPVAYFDGPGGTQVPRAVSAAIVDYLHHHNANAHWEFPTSNETDAMLAGARRTLADFLNADPSEVVFGPNMSTLTFHLARSLGRGFGPGDEIVVTELDHHANVDPWRALEKERGVTIRAVRMDPKAGLLDLEDLERQITGRTKLLAIGAASNALGTINDVAHAVRLARKAGALTFVDAVHYAPHRLPDVRAFDCDFLACSTYKFYGPHLGVLYGRHALLQGLDVPKLRPAPDTAPERLETGTQNHEGIMGAAAAVDFLAGLAPSGAGTRRERLRVAYDALHAHEMGLWRRLWSGLAEIGGVEAFGPDASSPRTPLTSFRVAGRTAPEVARSLAGHGLFASHGNFYALTAVERLGVGPDGLVRIGLSCYSTEEEIDRLLDALRALARP